MGKALSACRLRRSNKVHPTACDPLEVARVETPVASFRAEEYCKGHPQNEKTGEEMSDEPQITVASLSSASEEPIGDSHLTIDTSTEVPLRQHIHPEDDQPGSSAESSEDDEDLRSWKSSENDSLMNVSNSESMIISLSEDEVDFLRWDVGTTRSHDCDFSVIKLLGKGSFGVVSLAEHIPTQKMVAVKALRKVAMDQDRFESALIEREILGLVKKDKNPFLVGLISSYQTEKGLFIVMDYSPGGELASHIKTPISLQAMKFYSACIVLGIEFLHKNKFIHRDLKPRNILLDERGYARIIDYGLCKEGIGYKDEASSGCGTFYYMAPEIFTDFTYTRTVDWWSLGVIIYEMYFGKVPFYDKDSLISKEPSYPLPMEKDIYGILKRLLKKNPRRRLGASRRDAEEIKERPFFVDINWEDLRKRKIQAPFIP